MAKAMRLSGPTAKASRALREARWICSCWLLAPGTRGQKGSEAARLGMAGMRGERKAGLETQAGKPGLMEEVLCEWTFTANTQSCLRGREGEVAPGRADQPRS